MGVRFEISLWEPEVLNVHEFFTQLLSMEGKYAVKLSIPRLVGNEGNVIMVAYGKCKCGLTPDATDRYAPYLRGGPFTCVVLVGAL